MISFGHHQLESFMLPSYFFVLTQKSTKKSQGCLYFLTQFKVANAKQNKLTSFKQYFVLNTFATSYS